MQNAYRNLTNRVEEALGDSALLRIYEQPAVFGFFFFILDGAVARGRCEQGENPNGGIPPFLTLVEDGGDFFDLSEIDRYKRKEVRRARKTDNGEDVARQDTISVAQQSLLDLVAKQPSATPTVHYDAMALVAATIKRSGDSWSVRGSEVNPALDYRHFTKRLVEVAKLRELL